MTTIEKRRLRDQKRRLLEKDWLAPAGSEQEKRILKRWAKHEGMSKQDRDMIHAAIDYRDESARRSMLFWQVVKPKLLGEYIHKTAMDRHRTLKNNE